MNSANHTPPLFKEHESKMALIPRVLQWLLKSAMEMPVLAQRRSLKHIIFIVTIVLLLSLLLLRLEHIMAEGADGVPQRYTLI